ncbi:hypothetical protein UF75_0953 [Desulfosporosinus sp. I2]|nr:hypothetical protein UF75_0953 [Desulfosporosinus sp. I2]
MRYGSFFRGLTIQGIKGWTGNFGLRALISEGELILDLEQPE